jgi:serine/threonine protein phosphatase 1
LRRLLRVLPAEDRLIFNGDVINRGPQILEAMDLVWSQVRSGRAVWLRGNHEADLVDALNRDDRDTQRALAGCDTYRQLGDRTCRRWQQRLESLPSLYPGRGWIATHAGLDPSTWQPDLRIRKPFWQAYDGRFGEVVVAHTPGHRVRRQGWIVLIDTGACYGGELSAYCPETGAIVQVPGARQPLAAAAAQRQALSAGRL